MPANLSRLEDYAMKERAFPIILSMVRSGAGFSTCIARTRWDIGQWRSWMALKPERTESLRLAEAEGHKVALETLRDRAFALYGKWLDSVEERLADGGKPLAKGDVDQLRTMIEGRLPDLRERKVKAEEAAPKDNFGFDD